MGYFSYKFRENETNISREGDKESYWVIQINISLNLIVISNLGIKV